MIRESHRLPTSHHPSIPTPFEVQLAVSLRIITPSALLRDGLAHLFGGLAEFELLGLAGDVDQFGHPQAVGECVLVDGQIEPTRLVSWIRHWRQCDPQGHVVVIELEDQLDLIVACIEAGAQAYTLRGTALSDLIQVIYAVRSGEMRCAPHVTARLCARLVELQGQVQQSVFQGSDLTPREREILRLLIADYSNQQIAEALVIEVRTVKHHVHNILNKLQVRHRWDAVRVALSRGIR